MKKTVLIFGIISGVISSALLLATLPFMDKMHDSGNGYVVGYSGMILSFLLIFFGIRSYRDNIANGMISFGKAFKVGILITAISCSFYVLTWEIVYFNFMPDFLEKYAKCEVDKMKKDGATEAETTAKMAEMMEFNEKYQNPLFNAAVTFCEPLPVGLLITLISAGLLKRKETADS